jgi:hypothetical protein
MSTGLEITAGHQSMSDQKRLVTGQTCHEHLLGWASSPATEQPLFRALVNEFNWYSFNTDILKYSFFSKNDSSME